MRDLEAMISPDRTRRDILRAGAAAGLLGYANTGIAATALRSARQHSIRPGQVWLDTAGKPIQAHAGSLIAVGDSYYWYGENKQFTDGKHGIESWGIRFYRSRDLYNWEDLGPIIAPDEQDPSSPLSPRIFPERPHIVFHPVTRQYVCWIKIRNPKLAYQYRTVLVADAITGPYRMVRRELKPLGMSAGDFDIVVDEATHKAFMVFEHAHEEVVCVELTDDWTDVTDRYTRSFTGSRPPTTPEGIACFRKDGDLYLTSSQMTGYFPNPSRVAVSKTLTGPFSDLGELCPSDRSRSTFNAQISSIFRHPRKRGLYIALADRWMPNLSGQPDFESGALSETVRRAIGKATAKPSQPLTDEERTALIGLVAVTNLNTSISTYVWLPIRFDHGKPTIAWQGEWRIEDFR
jgi:hypothetical protein